MARTLLYSIKWLSVVLYSQFSLCLQNHGQGSGMRTSRSFPGSNRGSGWWQAIIQQFSPFFGHRLEPIHSPVDVSEDAASDATSDFENDRDHDTGDDLHSKVHFDLNVQDMDDLDGPQWPLPLWSVLYIYFYTLDSCKVI